MSDWMKETEFFLDMRVLISLSYDLIRSRRELCTAFALRATHFAHGRRARPEWRHGA